MRGRLVGGGEPSLLSKFARVRWTLVLLLAMLGAIGTAMLYSAADGSLSPWANQHLIRLLIALGLTVAVAVTDLRFWLRSAYAIYAVSAVLLLVVDLAGVVGMGAQRWLNLGVINLQPSELMKVAMVLALARYFHGLSVEDLGRPLMLLVPLLIVLVPVALVLKQPDLGTAAMLLGGGAIMFFAAGVRLWMFAVAAVAVIGALPIGWQLLHDYQRRRVLTFLDPDSDPLGAGYHITQSKIALGSGGLFGKGYLKGTQSHLNFLPEKQTDFIFTMFAEEFGLVGTLSLLTLITLVIAYGFVISVSARHQFGRLLAMGITGTFFLYTFFNIAMVMGLIPVVGVPLPLISYGGTAVLTVMLGFGLVLSVYVHRDLAINRHGLGP